MMKNIEMKKMIMNDLMKDGKNRVQVTETILNIDGNIVFDLDYRIKERNYNKDIYDLKNYVGVFNFKDENEFVCFIKERYFFVEVDEVVMKEFYNGIKNEKNISLLSMYEINEKIELGENSINETFIGKSRLDIRIQKMYTVKALNKRGIYLGKESERIINTLKNYNEVKIAI